MTSQKIFLSILSLLTFALSDSDIMAQTLTPDLQKTSTWETSSHKAIPIQESGRQGIKFNEQEREGILILKNYEFTNGTIEIDLKGRDLQGKSFLGVAFHIQNEKVFDLVYFRPFNFSNPDSVRRSHAVQYVSAPDFPWEKLRKESPLKYENYINPVPDGDDWFHAKIVVRDREVKVYVNGSSKPCLEVEKLTDTKSGSIALWVGPGSDGAYSNLKIVSKK
ncbi:MAG: hypothetical protein HOP08_19625 [Cyclobacteriaceae bacterium]|nr:hypothetical protein [Cyclobacteriaceae bacterium]